MNTTVRYMSTFCLLFASCSNSNFASSAAVRTKNKTQDCVPSTTQKCPSSTVEEGTITPLSSLQTHEAVFAVRDISCALCHAKVNASIISDFGIASGQVSAVSAMHDLMLVVNKRTDAKTYFIDENPPEFSGKFIVPTGDISIGQNYLGTDQTLNCGIEAGTLATTVTKTSLINSLKKCVEPKFKWSADSQKFVAKEKVEINPVSSPADVKALADQSVISSKGFAPVAGATIEGITGNATSGFKAAAAVKCEGAIVFDGPVLLQNTVINTQKGCRIYSTGSIFLFDAVTVAGPEDTANLQLLSPLYVGLDMPILGQCHPSWTGCTKGEGVLEHRLVTYGGRLHEFSRGTGAQVYALIKADGAKLGINSLKGSGSLDYSHIAATAPVVYSRSSGKFTGVIIAEQFLGKIGALSFNFDPIFKPGDNALPLYPEIKAPLVVAQ